MTNMIKKNLSFKVAKCLCGGIKIKVKEKLRHVINCHCLQCMKTHGNFASYTSTLERDIICLLYTSPSPRDRG